MGKAVAGVIPKGKENTADRASAESAPNPMVWIGFWCYAFYVFSYYSGVFDLGLSGLHLPAVALWTAVAAAMLTGRFVSALRNPISLTLVALTAWLFVTVPFSFWRGGSMRVVTTQWGQAMAVFAVGVSVTATLSYCRRGLYVIGLAIGVVVLLVTVRGGASGERLLLANSRFMNSNTIAMTVLLGLPFLWLLADSADAGKVRKAIAYAMMVVAVVALVRTGSREGMVALGILSVSVFLRSSATGKLKIVAASFMFCAAFVVFVPHSLLSRFSTIFQGAHVELSESDDATTEEKKLMISAAGSSEDRWNLLVGSLRLTAENPVFGVGPGNFSAYIAKEAALKGVWTNWNGTHNTYTQLSAEAGIPGVCLFVLALGLCMRELKRIYRRAGRIPGRQARDIAVMALAVRCSFISYLICALFTHLGYDLMMPLMCGIVVAMSRTAPEELARLEREMDNSGSAPASPPASSPAPPRAAAVRPGPVRTPRDAYPSRAGRQAPQVR